MNPYWTDGQVTLHHGDCLDVLASLPEASADAVVTDPPYGLEFMGREWDGADGFRRSLNRADAGRGDVFGRTSRTSPEYRTSGAGQRGKPGIGDRPTEWVSNQGWNGYRCRNCGHLAHGGSPCACEEPEFVAADNRWPMFQEWCRAWAAECLRLLKPGGYLLAFGGTRTSHRLVCGVEDAGFEIRDSLVWLYGSGFPKGRACLKPSHEPVMLARKPAPKSAPLNIDACRVESAAGDSWNSGPGGGGFTSASYERGLGRVPPTAGRWPPNVLLTHSAACNGDCAPDCPVAELDAQSGITTSGSRKAGTYGLMGYRAAGAAPMPAVDGDTGGASRFYPTFRYEAKAPTSERPRLPDGTAWPTVKPLALMRWLVRLITPPGGTVLDPFAGTGTTGEACALEGFQSILIERDPTAVALIEQRLSQGILPMG